MKTPNTHSIVPDMTGPDEDDDEDLRALTTVDLDDDDDSPRYQAVDEFSNEFLIQDPQRSTQAPRGKA